MSNKSQHLDEADTVLASAGLIMHLLRGVPCPGCAVDVLLRATSSLVTALNLPVEADESLHERFQELLDEDREMRKEFAELIGKVTPKETKNEFKNTSDNCSKKFH